MSLALPIISGSIITAIIIAAIFFVQILNRRRILLESLQLRLLLIKLPKETVPQESKNPLEEINFSSQLFTTLTNIKIPVVFEVAVPNVGEEICFYLAVPSASIEFVSRQIQGFWPNAQIEPTEDYTIFNPHGGIAAAYVKQKEPSALPIRTFIEANTDTFLPILSDFSKLRNIHEGMAMQLIIKPASKLTKKEITKFLTNLKQGKLVGKEKNKEGIRIVDEEKIKAVQNKLAKPLFSVIVRLIASAENSARAEEILNGLVGSFSQFSSPTNNEFKAIIPRNAKNLISQYIFRKPEFGQSMILGVDELASIFHLPTSFTNIPKIKWLESKEAPPPIILPEEGVIIGENIFRGETKPIRLGEEDRRRHLYTVGQTGTGKSNLIANMIAQDIEAGKGVGVIDPHGDLIESVLKLVPENRFQDVIIFDPGDVQRPLGLNMLEYNAARPEEKTFIVNEMQSIFNKLFTAETMGPMFEQYMRNALLLLMDSPEEQATLTEVPRVFTDSEFRKRFLAKAANPTVIDFWEKEAVKAGGEASLANITPYITSKFNNFIANDFVRPIIGQPQSSFNFRDVMDAKKILLINLSKGRIGDINANLLGMIFVGKLLMAAFSRINIPETQRQDFYLYIDEFQNFTTDSIVTILSEARKYRLNLVIAHQFIKQLSDKIRDAVFGNIGSIIAFRIGPEDAEFLVKQFEPVFSKNDLINVSNFKAHTKLLVNGQSVKPFNIRTIPTKAGTADNPQKLKELSGATYGRNRQEVEINILNRLRQ